MKKYCDKPAVPKGNDSEKCEGIKLNVRFQEFSIDLFGDNSDVRCVNGKKMPIVQLLCVYPGVQLLVNPTKVDLNIICTELKAFCFSKNLSKFLPASGMDNIVSRTRTDVHAFNASNISVSSRGTANKMPDIQLSDSIIKPSTSITMPPSVSKNHLPSMYNQSNNEKKLSGRNHSAIIKDRHSSVIQRCFLVMKDQNASALRLQCLLQEKANSPTSFSSELALGPIAFELDYSILGDICEMLRPYRELHCVRCRGWGKNKMMRGVIFDQKENPDKILTPVDTLRARELAQLDPVNAIDVFLDNKNVSFILKTKEMSLTLHESERKANFQIVEPESFATLQTAPCQWALKKEGGKTSVNTSGINFTTTKSFGFVGYFIKRFSQFLHDNTVSEFLDRYHKIYSLTGIKRPVSKSDKNIKKTHKAVSNEILKKQELTVHHFKEFPTKQNLAVHKEYQQSMKEQKWRNLVKKGKEQLPVSEVEECEKPIQQPNTGEKIVRLSQMEESEFGSFNSIIQSHKEFASIRSQNSLPPRPLAAHLALAIKQARPNSRISKENIEVVMEVIDEPIPKVNRISKFQAFRHHKN